MSVLNLFVDYFVPLLDVFTVDSLPISGNLFYPDETFVSQMILGKLEGLGFSTVGPSDE